MDKYNMEDLRTVEAQIASLVKTRDKILAGMADENKKQTNDSSQVVCDGMKDFTCVKKLEVDKDTVVCYQGVPGAYSQQAMFRFFGKKIQNINVPDFGDVIEMVKNGKADYGVLPIENSSAGFVNGIYDMVGNNDVTIVGEEEVHVAHALMGVPGSDLSRIKTVYSHTQGLLQCTNYLSRKPWKQCSVANTAVAAVKVIEEGDKTQAAIASELAAELYGLQILAKDIVNNDNNTTRFIILSKQKIFVEKAENISIRFNLSKEKVDNLKELIIKKLKGQKIHFNEFWALKNINFELQKGDRLGILGLNGAGKSTLLKVIAGVYKPTTGTVKRYGHIAPMIELGAGFDPNYTGRENVFLYGSVLGFSREFLEEKYDEILEFSELGEFIDVPIKNYSSGMRARLGFSIATVVEPEILILDEVLSVGDAKFRKKCERKMQKMFDHGVTVLFVSHSLAQVKRLCNKAILLEHGQLIAQGDIDDVSEIYERKLEE